MRIRTRILLAALTLTVVSLATVACMSGGRPAKSNAELAASPTSIPMVSTGGFHCDGFVPAKPGWSCFQSVAKYGVRCSGYIAQGQTPNPVPAPPSYSVRDIGRPGVPALGTSDLKTIAAIARKTGTRTLRFAILSYYGRPTRLPAFIVFDATDGPCDDDAPGYVVLNEAPYDNLFYEPGENPYSPHAGMP
jgi:hypothetical protein